MRNSWTTSAARLVLVLLLAAGSGCGPAPSDEASSLGAAARVGATPDSQPSTSGDRHTAAASQSPCAGASCPHGVPPAAGPAPLAAPVASDHESPSAVSKDEPPPLPEVLILPDWLAAALDHRDIRVRVQALDRWAQQGPNAPLDPLVVALDDENDEVREKAMAIIEQQWAVEQQRADSEQESPERD